MGPRDSLDWCRKSTAHINTQSPNSPGHSESLYPRQEACQWSRGSTLISALEEHKWLTSCLGHFNLGKETHYPLTRPVCLIWKREKFSTLLGLEPRLVDWLIGRLALPWTDMLLGWWFSCLMVQWVSVCVSSGWSVGLLGHSGSFSVSL